MPPVAGWTNPAGGSPKIPALKKSYLRTRLKKETDDCREENTAGESVANEVAISFEVFSFSLD